mgnify:FL=1
MMLKKILHILNSEFGRYILAGLSITVLNVALYTALLLFGMRYYWANLAAIITAKIYAYFINKFYVYRSFCHTPQEAASEMLKFFICRGGSGIFDYLSVILLVELFGCSDLYSKYFVLGIVILANYYLGKNYIFNQKGKKL